MSEFAQEIKSPSKNLSHIVQYGMAKPHMVNIPELKRETVTDPLTHILNVRGFKRAFERMQQYSIRDGKQMGHAFLDLDHFKIVNDVFGHDTADVLLREIAERSKHIVRQVDVVGRKGGDEFEFGFYDVDTLKDAEAIREKIQQSLLPSVVKGIEEGTQINFYPQLSMGMLFGFDGKTDSLDNQTQLSDGLMRILKAAREKKTDGEIRGAISSESAFNYAIADRKGIIHASNRTNFVNKSIHELMGVYNIQL